MKNSNDLAEILDKFAQVKILVVGDVMLDRYWWANASRLSPEAPVPVVALQKVSILPEARQTSRQTSRDWEQKFTCTGVVGVGDAAQSLRRVLTATNISPDFLVSLETRRTTTKTRVLVHNQQIARIDDETAKPLTAAEEEIVLSIVKDLISETDLIVLSDYAKGCLTATLVSSIIEQALREGKMILVDPKGADFTKYNGATLLTPNFSEAMTAAKIENRDEAGIEMAANKLLSETEISSLLVTLGEDGMKLFRLNHDSVHFSSLARQVFDVTGAGDTVIASLAVGMGTKSDICSVISIANIAAGLAVEKVGTSIITIDELRLALQEDFRHL